MHTPTHTKTSIMPLEVSDGHQGHVKKEPAVPQEPDPPSRSDRCHITPQRTIIVKTKTEVDYIAGI